MRLFALLLLCGGCRYYAVPDASLGALHGMSRRDRRAAVVEAYGQDGQRVGLRADRFRVVGVDTPGQSVVRVVDPLVPTGLIFLGVGLAVFTPGLALILQPCEGAACQYRPVSGAFGGGAMGAGAPHIVVGLVLTLVGALSHRLEIRK